MEQIPGPHIPFTRERVLAWVMPWGIHEGKRIIEIPREYLETTLEYIDPRSNAHRAITACLEMFSAVAA